MMLMGRVSHEGRENIRVKVDLTDSLSVKINAQVIYFKPPVKLMAICDQLHLIPSLNSFVDDFVLLQLTSEPHYSQGMLNFDYKVSLSLYT